MFLCGSDQPGNLPWRPDGYDREALAIYDFRRNGSLAAPIVQRSVLLRLTTEITAIQRLSCPVIPPKTAGKSGASQVPG
jgi:hypothetical protein